MLIARFIENESNFHAVVATRQESANRSLNAPVLSMADLSLRQQRALLQQFGITLTKHRNVFERLRHDRTLTDFAKDPLLLSMLGEHLKVTQETELQPTHYEVLDGIISTKLRTTVNSTGMSPEIEIRHAAEEIAYRMLTERADGTVTSVAQVAAVSATDTTMASADEITMLALVNAKLGSSDQSGFQFRHRAIQVHLAATYLLGDGQPGPGFQELITSELWHDVVVIALQAGSAEFRTAIVQASADLLVAEIARTQGLAPDVKACLEHEQPMIVPGSFIWPPLACRVLQLLRDGLRFKPALSPEPLPVDVVDAADRLIVTAMLAGGLAAKEQAI